MTDSITHVSGREKPPTDVIPLRAGDLCPRSSLRVSEAACTLARVRERPPLWMHAARTCTRRGPHRYGVANGEIQPATETVIPSLPSPFHRERLCSSISDSSPRLLYLEFIWCGSSGVGGETEPGSIWNFLGPLEGKSWKGSRIPRIPPPGPVRRISVDAISFKKFNRSCFRG